MLLELVAARPRRGPLASLIPGPSLDFVFIRLGREQADSVQLSRGLELNQETPRQELYECKMFLSAPRHRPDRRPGV